MSENMSESVLTNPALTNPASTNPVSTNPMALENQLCFALYSANRAMTALYRPLLEPLDLTYPQYLVFLVLWGLHDKKQLPCKVTHIGELLALDTGTLTPLLKRMEAKGWIVRKRFAADERVVGIDLTQGGVELKEVATAIPQQLLCASGINAKELHGIKSTIDALVCQLRKLGGSHG
jgi:DNA-binding MarR family transcriptional regulator